MLEIRKSKALAAAVMALVLAPSIHGQTRSEVYRSPERSQEEARLEATRKAELTESIVAERESAMGRPFAPSYRQRLKNQLARFSMVELQSVLDDGVRGNLLGPAQERDLDTAASETLAGIGGNNADLVFTPTAPCRLIDTRVAGGIMTSGLLRTFVVDGDLTPQGGNAMGCGLPMGKALSVMINIVTTSQTGPGFLRAFAWSNNPNPPLPNAAVQNYGVISGLGALANGISVPVCDPTATTCTFDMFIQANGGSTHLVVDIVGFFSKPARPAPPCHDNTGRFADCGNGTVTDQVTGLIWLKDADCLGQQSYVGASALVAALGQGTHPACNLTDGSSPGDWRVPTLDCPSSPTFCTLASPLTGDFAPIFSSACGAPFIPNTAGTGCRSEGNPFTGVQSSSYWSSSTARTNPGDAWAAFTMGAGFINTVDKSNPAFVWPVRGGEQRKAVALPSLVAMVSISGKVTFDSVPHNNTTNGLDYCNITQQPSRDVIVEAIMGANTLVSTTRTDANGDYSLMVPANTSVFLRVKAQMKQTGSESWDFMVVDNTSGQALYAMDGPPSSSGATNSVRNLNAASGFTGDCMNPGNPTAYSATRTAAPFALLDGIYKSYRKVLDADPNNVTFAPLLINWSVNNTTAPGNLPAGMIGTSFYNGAGELYILGKDGVDTDEYDDHVMIHEWGHYFEDKLSRSDSIGGAHLGGDQLDPRLAFGEGFGNALSGMVTDDPFYRDSAGVSNAAGFAVDVENNANANPGWYSEGSVQSILFDMYDGPGTGDTDADPVTLVFGPIYQIMIGTQKTTPALTTIFSFTTELKNANAGSAAGIDTVVGGQAIVGATMDIFGSTETNSGNPANANVLPVYTNVTTGGAGTVDATVCSIKDFGPLNKLAVFRFLKFDVAAAGNVTVTVAGSSGNAQDAFFTLFKQGMKLAPGDIDTNEAGFPETHTYALTPGTHVLQVADASNDPNPNCFNVTVD